MPAWLTFKNIRNSSGKNETFVKIATWVLMRTWLVFENVCNSWGNNEISSQNNANASWLKGNLHRRFSRESLCENEKTYFCKDLRAPLSSPLFKRILQREYEKCPRPMVAKDPCHRHFYRESCSENQKSKNSKQKNTQRSKPATGNHDNKKPRLGGLCFTCV